MIGGIGGILYLYRYFSKKYTILVKTVLKDYGFLFLGGLHVILVLMAISLLGAGMKGDSAFYIQIAEGFSSAIFFDPLLNWKFGPAYPFFLVIVGSWNAYNLYWIASIQAILFVLAIRKLCKGLFPGDDLRAVSLTLFGIIMLAPNFILTNATLMSESLCSSLILLIYYMVFLSKNRHRDIWASFLAGALIMIRYEMLMFVAIIAFVALIWRQIYSLKQIAVWLSIPVVFLILNSWKNNMTYSVPSPTGFSGWAVIYAGNNFSGDGSWHPHVHYKIGYIAPEYLIKYEVSIDSGGVGEKIMNQNALFREMVFASWEQDSWKQIKAIPIKLLRTILLPADLDIYTMTPPKQNKGVRIADHFGSSYSMLGNIKHAVFIGAHWLLLIGILLGILKLIKIKETNMHYERFYWLSILSITSVALVYSIVLYGLPRFNAAWLPLLAINIGFFIRSRMGL